MPLIDYFRAPDAAAALRVLERDGGPGGVGGPGQPEFDVVTAKAVHPQTSFAALVTALPERPADGGALFGSSYIWPGTTPPTAEECRDLPGDSPWMEGPWIEEFPAAVRDLLADVPEARMPAIAAAWSASGEAPWWSAAPAGADLVPLLSAFAELARRARADGDRLYCWSAL
ncbi:hypothetical protein [Yinghuangia soli]|uniref:DUF1877 family protein n=1 Tax=Yinghuangia soli TaxID=2908204 RepID=A0AA41PYW3_9ACTN|nr:hypothetical protein [Yinghuangia soli]MCF2527691.1 hypothetical protein [Yinghuangia soli]